MNKKCGFSLIELIIVIGVIGIMAAIGAYSWQRYVANANLRTAARELVADFNFMKANAAAKPDLTCTITFNRAVNPSTYILEAKADGNNAGGFPRTKTPAAAGSAINITSLPGSDTTYTLKFLARGTLDPSAGTIKMRNNRGSEAAITYNFTGKTYVVFTMQ